MEGILGWLVRFIVLTIVVNLVWRLITGRRPQRAQGAARPARGGATERAGGALVRDPHCGTYIVQSHALRLGAGPEAHFFCSDNCRTAYQAAHPQ